MFQRTKSTGSTVSNITDSNVSLIDVMKMFESFKRDIVAILIEFEKKSRPSTMTLLQECTVYMQRSFPLFNFEMTIEKDDFKFIRQIR